MREATLFLFLCWAMGLVIAAAFHLWPYDHQEDPVCGRLILAISQETEAEFLMRRVVMCGRDIEWEFINPYHTDL